MAAFNTSQEYGAVTKFFHWLIVILFTTQYFFGHAMMEHFGKPPVLGLSGDTLFSWHKSLGLVILAVVVLRLLNRTFTRLPDWAPTLSKREKRVIHGYEKLLYLGMLIMPISGYVYVMAGGYGIHFFEAVYLTNPIGKWAELAVAAKWVHIVSSWIILAAIAAHLFVVLRHQLFVRDNLLGRMLPGGKARELREAATESA